MAWKNREIWVPWRGKSANSTSMAWNFLRRKEKRRLSKRGAHGGGEGRASSRRSPSASPAREIKGTDPFKMLSPPPSYPHLRPRSSHLTAFTRAAGKARGEAAGGSRHWRLVLPFLQTLEDGFGKCSKGWRPVSANGQRLEAFLQTGEEVPVPAPITPSAASRGLGSMPPVFQTLEAGFGGFPRIGRGFWKFFQTLETGFGGAAGELQECQLFA